jgi:hypothetical protein
MERGEERAHKKADCAAVAYTNESKGNWTPTLAVIGLDLLEETGHTTGP